jgi:hypothetical protein
MGLVKIAMKVTVVVMVMSEMRETVTLAAAMEEVIIAEDYK